MLPPDGVLPAVVISDVSGNDAVQEIDKRLSAFEKIDDVYQRPFGSNLILMFKSEPVSSSIISQLRQNSSSRFSTISQASISAPQNSLPSGPYFLYGSNIHQAWRLYADNLDSFVFAVIPEDLQNHQRFVFSSLIFRNSFSAN